MGLFGEELALNRPHRLGLSSLCILDMCSTGDQACASVWHTLFIVFDGEKSK
jgi:hypothetical protein